MAKETRHFMDEADIGSGEKTPGQHETEKEVASVKVPQIGNPQDGRQLQEVVEEQQYADRPSALNGRNQENADQQGPLTQQPNLASHFLQSGTHIARVAVAYRDDKTYEAQVFVRLTREPQIAETYIPVGIFGSEAEALAAAEDRARRALKNNEF